MSKTQNAHKLITANDNVAPIAVESLFGFRPGALAEALFGNVTIAA